MLYGLIAEAVAGWCAVPSRRLEDRIRELCARAVIAQGPELDQTLLDLQSALHEHIARLRRMTATKLVGDGEEKKQRRSG
jgi:hypothetical protein